MEARVSIRKSLEMQMVRAYLNFTMPKMAPNFIDLLPEKYQFADAPGHVEFCTAYELEYERGCPVEARELYEGACRLGHPLANYCYGLWFLAGDRAGTEKNLRKAFQKFCVAHKAGLGQATYQLADFYRTGKGKVVGRDVKKSFAFLHQSVLDPRIHFVLDCVPFCLLGLSYGLGRGPSTASISDAVRCLEKGIRYAHYQQHAESTVAFGSPIIVDAEFSCMYQLAMLAMQWDAEEIKRQVSIRLDAMETFFGSYPPGRTMLTLSEFAFLAKSFGLDYDEYLQGLSEGKGGKRMTWKSFRHQTDGRAKTLCVYERQLEVERWAPLEPDDEEVRKFLEESDKLNEEVGGEGGVDETDFGAGAAELIPLPDSSRILPEEDSFSVTGNNNHDTGTLTMPKNDGDGAVDNGVRVLEKEENGIPKTDEPEKPQE